MLEANLLKALGDQGKSGCLENLILYGTVRCAIQKPNVVGSSLKSCSKGAFAILDCFGLKCLGTDYFRERGSTANSIYLTKGSMLIYIDSPNWVGKEVKVSGNNFRYGVKVRQQFNHKATYDGISAFVFKKEGSDFVVYPNSIVELGSHDEDIRLTPLEDFVLKLEKGEPIQYPITLDSITSYEGVLDYTELSSFQDASIKFVESNEKIDVTKIDLKLTHHLEAKERTSIYGMVEDEINEMSKKRKMYTAELLSDLHTKMKESDSATDSIVSRIRGAFISRVATKYNENIGTSTVKGKVYVGELLSNLMGKPIGDVTLEESNSFKLPEISEAISRLSTSIQAMPDLLYDDGIDGMVIPRMREDKDFSLAVISVTTGIDLNSLIANYHTCNKATTMSYNLWYFTLLYCPYVLGMVGSSLNIVELDKIYFSYTTHLTNNPYSKENAEMRTNLLYLQTLESADEKNTLISPSTLRGKQAKYPSLGLRYLSTNNFPAKKDLVDLLTVMCGRPVQLTERAVEYLKNVKWYSKDRTDYLIEKGVVNMIDSDIILEKDLEKEFLIYSTLIEKGKQLTGITDEQIEDTIQKFEQEKGFPLESLQRDGIKICKYKAGVLSGCAGSGKTTTSDCISEAILDNLKGYVLVYGTPTGKACRRLAEVVGGTVRTLHSEFGIGLFGDSYLSDVTKKAKKRKNEKAKGCAYLLDEMAMTSTSLLYEVVRSLSENDIVYFLGDIKQLPPIGKGNPFALLMKLLPCVELGVSKRAAEGSEVNYNTTLINCMSDEFVQELYFDDKTFLCDECLDVEIPRTVANMWKGFMDGSLVGEKYTEEDIQVISGYATPEKLYSSTNLNKPLQAMLRKNDKLLFKHGDTDFYKNERVIHVKVNSYGKQRYVEEAYGFRGVVTSGIVNGEMGTLEGIVRSDMVEIQNFDEGDLEDRLYNHLSAEDKEKLLNERAEKVDKMQDDSVISDEKTYFVKVKVYDVDLKMDVYVLYQGRLVNQDDCVYLSGYELDNLELAYALTTHKMQGSQSPIVILPFGSDCNPQFINRNMINTMVTRSQGIVGMVGTIKGADSPVTKGRQIPSVTETNDLFSLLVNTD